MKRVFWVLLGLAVSAQALTGNPKAGQVLSTTHCAACHNQDGNSSTPIWPNIAGQHESYLIQQLIEFKKGAQGNRNQPVMASIVAQMSEQDFADMAAYFATQPPKLGMASPSLVDSGQALYRGGHFETGVSACSACHGPAGLGNEAAGFPRLAGQNAAYIVDQLKKFRSGERHNDPGDMMQDIAKHMTEADMDAVASYIQGLRPAGESE